MADHIMQPPPFHQSVPWWWRFADPAPDFLKHLKDDDYRVIIGAQIDQQISAVKAQRAMLDVQATQLQDQENILTQMKEMLTSKRKSSSG